MVDVKDYETRPTPIKAVQFLGDEECAKEIIDWVFENSGTANWSRSYGQGDNVQAGVPSVELVEVLMITSQYTYEVEKGDWIVLEEGGIFTVMNDDRFTSQFVPTMNTQANAFDKLIQSNVYSKEAFTDGSSTDS
jgi:hypothetical protein